MSHSTSHNDDSDHRARSDRVIEDIATRIDGKDVYSPVIDWRWLAALAGALFALALFAAVLIFGYVLRQGQLDDAKANARADAIEECARRYATRVTNADTENDIAQDDLILYLATPPELRDPSREDAIRNELIRARELMSVARDERLRYEATLTLPCPIEPLAVKLTGN